MAELSRMAGAILIKSREQYFLVGDLKEPCDFNEKGFEDPGSIDPLVKPYTELSVSANPQMSGSVLQVDVEGDELCRIISERLLIKRNGSVSNRLWDLIMDGIEKKEPVMKADWLVRMPDNIWNIVREEILRCS